MSGRQTALVRAVNAMVRAMGGAAITLHIATASRGTERELGLEAPAMQEVELAPVIVRNVAGTGEAGTIEAAISTSILETVLPTYGQTDALAFLRSAEQLAYGNEVFVITSVSAERFAGVEYLYRIRAAGKR